MKIRHYITTHGFNAVDYYGHNVKLAEPAEAEFSFLADETVNPLEANTNFGANTHIEIDGKKYPLKTENS